MKLEIFIILFISFAKAAVIFKTIFLFSENEYFNNGLLKSEAVYVSDSLVTEVVYNEKGLKIKSNN
jgi:hypothetical protein